MTGCWRIPRANRSLESGKFGTRFDSGSRGSSSTKGGVNPRAGELRRRFVPSTGEIAEDMLRPVLPHLTRDTGLLFATRFIRLFAYGSLSVVLVFYLVGLGLSEQQAGLLLTADACWRYGHFPGDHDSSGPSGASAHAHRRRATHDRRRDWCSRRRQICGCFCLPGQLAF